MSESVTLTSETTASSRQILLIKPSAFWTTGSSGIPRTTEACVDACDAKKLDR